MVRWWKDQANLFNAELKMSAKRKTMGCYSPKYPELDQTLWTGFQCREVKVNLLFLQNNEMLRSADICQIVLQCLHKLCEWPLVIGPFLMLSKQVEKPGPSLGEAVVGRDSGRDGEKIVQSVQDLKRPWWNRRRRHLRQRNAWGSWRCHGGWVRDWQRWRQRWLKT